MSNDLTAPLVKSESWTFRSKALSEVHQSPVRDAVRIVFTVTAYYEITVEERLAFDATRLAAMLLGVAPDQLELVQSPFMVKP